MKPQGTKMDIKEITVGKSYACKFKVETMLDQMGRPAPNLSDVPIKGTGIYESIGILMQRDTDKELVKLKDEKSRKEFVVPFSDIWDVDEVEWVDPLETQDG
jgi:hypothetical protein